MIWLQWLSSYQCTILPLQPGLWNEPELTEVTESLLQTFSITLHFTMYGAFPQPQCHLTLTMTP